MHRNNILVLKQTVLPEETAFICSVFFIKFVAHFLSNLRRQSIAEIFNVY